MTEFKTATGSCDCHSCQICKILELRFREYAGYDNFASFHVAELIINLMAHDTIDPYLDVVRDRATWFCAVPRDCIGVMLPYLSSDNWFAGYHHSFADDRVQRYGYAYYNSRLNVVNSDDEPTSSYIYSGGEIMQYIHHKGPKTVTTTISAGYKHGVSTSRYGVYRHYFRGSVLIQFDKNMTAHKLPGGEWFASAEFTPELRRTCFAAL